MTVVRLFEPDDFDAVVALWRRLDPEAAWLDDPQLRESICDPNPQFERIRFVVERDDALLATVSAICMVGERPRKRYVRIETRHEDVGEWLAVPLHRIAEADREQPGSTQMVEALPPLAKALAHYLLAAGFVHSSNRLRMEWDDEHVPVIDLGPLRLERYSGGDRAIDAAIGGLHDRGYDPRFIPRADIERLWQSWPGLERREYVLAWDGARLAGFAEWFIFKGEPWFNSLVVARSHWGTNAALGIGFAAMAILRELGYRTLHSSVVSTNAPSLKLQLRNRWRIAGEVSQTYLRAF